MWYQLGWAIIAIWNKYIVIYLIFWFLTVFALCLYLSLACKGTNSLRLTLSFSLFYIHIIHTQTYAHTHTYMHPHKRARTSTNTQIQPLAPKNIFLKNFLFGDWSLVMIRKRSFKFCLLYLENWMWISWGNCIGKLRWHKKVLEIFDVSWA